MTTLVLVGVISFLVSFAVTAVPVFIAEWRAKREYRRILAAYFAVKEANRRERDAMVRVMSTNAVVDQQQGQEAAV